MQKREESTLLPSSKESTQEETDTESSNDENGAEFRHSLVQKDPDEGISCREGMCC